MRTLVRRELYSDLVKVYVIEDFPPRALTPRGLVGDDVQLFEWREFTEGEEPPVLLALPTRVMESVATALTEIVPALPATEEALQDTRTVRDRLLTLVEQLATGRSA